VLVVSHDRWFLNRVCTHILAFEDDGHVELSVGDYDYYLEKSKLSDARAAITAGFTDARPTQAKAAAPAKVTAPIAVTVAKKPTANELRKFREEVGQLEKKVSELEAKQSEITSALEDPASYADKGKFHHLNRELSAVVDQLTAATTAWENAATKLAEMEK
jgi:ATP-binding cassette subfamily F protein 3